MILATDEEAVELFGRTMNVYTHTELAEQTAAIAALPGPPAGGDEGAGIATLSQRHLMNFVGKQIGQMRQRKPMGNDGANSSCRRHAKRTRCYDYGFRLKMNENC